MHATKVSAPGADHEDCRLIDLDLLSLSVNLMVCMDARRLYHPLYDLLNFANGQLQDQADGSFSLLTVLCNNPIHKLLALLTIFSLLHTCITRQFRVLFHHT